MSNIVNIFTGAKTKRRESEIANRDCTIVDCEGVSMSEGTIKALLDCQLRNFSTGSRQYDPLKEEYADESKAEVKIKPD